MDKLRIGELYTKLKPRILELINTIGGGTGPFAPTPHGLNSPHHTGSLDDTQAPQFLKIDGTRDLIGNLNVANGITIDGVDISALSAAYDAHLITDAHTIYAHAEGSGTRRAYEAGRLNKSILAGNGLTGGGLLTTDQTLSVLLNASWSGLSVDSNGLRVNTAAAFVWTNDHVFQGLTKTRHLQPELTDTYDLGTSTLLWRKGWLSELDAVVFAQNTVTLLGGWLLISKDEGTIDADVGPADTQIVFGKTMTVGDFVLLRAAGKVEYMQVGSLVSGTTYNVTRNLDGSGADAWPAGTPFAVLGQSGQGRIELNAYDTPRIQLIRQGATYNAQTEIIRIGDLNGNWGYTSQKWGVAIGEYASGKANITIDQDGVLRIRNFATDIIKLSGTDATLENVLKIAGTSSAIAIGNPPPTSSTAGTGLWIDRTGLYGLQSNVRQAYFGSDGKLYAGGGNVILDNNGLRLVGYSVNQTSSTSIKFGATSSVVDAAIYFTQDSNTTGLRLISENNFYEKMVQLGLFKGNDKSQISVLARSSSNTETEIFLYSSLSDDYISFQIGSSYMTLYKQYNDAYGKVSLSSLTLSLSNLPSVANPDPYGTETVIFGYNRTIWIAGKYATVPIGVSPPWLVAPEAVQFLYNSWNPIVNLNFQMRDLGVPEGHRRLLTAQSAWTGHTTFGRDKTIANSLEYYGTNSTNQYFFNTSPLWIHADGFVFIMWFYPTSSGANRGLVENGIATVNFAAYIHSSGKVVFDVFDTSNTQRQIMSTNYVTYNAWNYIIYRYYRNSEMSLILNGVKTSGGVPTLQLRTASGDFRLGWSNYAGAMYGYLGWTAYSASWQPTDEIANWLIDISRAWHKGGA